MLSTEQQIFHRAWEIAEPDIAVICKVVVILYTARRAIAALPDLSGPWPVKGHEAATTLALLAELTPDQHAAEIIYQHALERARVEQQEGILR